METLGKLFGSESRVKILRLFLFNSGAAFRADEIAERSKANLYTVKHEIKLLRKIGFIKPKACKKPKKRGTKIAVGVAKGWTLEERFAYLLPLRNLLLGTVLLSDEEIYQRFAGAGKLKVVIVAGIFTQNMESRLDLLIAGEQLKKLAIENTVKKLEAELGKELTYAAFDLAELNYRVKMYDRLLRDIMENPHRTLLDKIGFEGKFTEGTKTK